MFKQNYTDSNSNFWISYADLMAGLLFVFILLIGAIVSKSSLLKNELHTKEDKLQHLSSTLKDKERYILEKDKLLAKKNAEIEKEKQQLTQASRELQRKNAKIAQDNLLLSKNDRLLKLKLDEIANLNKLLLEQKTKADRLSGKIVIVQAQLDEKEENLKKTKAQLESEQKTRDTTKKKLEAYEGKVMILSNELTESKNAVKLKDEKLLTLLAAMDQKKTKYDDLVAKLQAQKAKIKSLTGIKLQVVAALKEALGSKIDIDKKTGSLKLASNILFSVGKSTLKDEAKVELKKAFEEYIGTLISDENIKPHLDKIIIEGHTDSDGGYIYNLKLSQDRALSVMEYLLTLDFSKKHNIQPLMIASGRAYLDAIVENGIENKEASRRIEIKFRLKNEDAMHEIEKVLDAQ